MLRLAFTMIPTLKVLEISASRYWWGQKKDIEVDGMLRSLIITDGYQME